MTDDILAQDLLFFTGEDWTKDLAKRAISLMFLKISSAHLNYTAACSVIVTHLVRKTFQQFVDDS